MRRRLASIQPSISSSSRSRSRSQPLDPPIPANGQPCRNPDKLNRGFYVVRLTKELSVRQRHASQRCHTPHWHRSHIPRAHVPHDNERNGESTNEVSLRDVMNGEPINLEALLRALAHSALAQCHYEHWLSIQADHPVLSIQIQSSLPSRRSDAFSSLRIRRHGRRRSAPKATSTATSTSPCRHLPCLRRLTGEHSTTAPDRLRNSRRPFRVRRDHRPNGDHELDTRLSHLPCRSITAPRHVTRGGPKPPSTETAPQPTHRCPCSSSG